MGRPIDELTPKELAQLKIFIETYLRKALKDVSFSAKDSTKDSTADSASASLLKAKNTLQLPDNTSIDNPSITDSLRKHTKQPHSMMSKVLRKKMEQEAEKQKQATWLEVIPHGLVGGMIPNICIMVFREKTSSNSFAVPMSSVQAKIIINQGSKKGDPFRFIKELLRALNLRINECYLQQEKKQILARVVIKDSNDSVVQSLQLPAGDIIPCAMYIGCSFYCTKQFIKAMLDQEIDVRLSDLPSKKPLYLN